MSDRQPIQLTEAALRSLHELDHLLRKSAVRAISWLERDPQPDGLAKREAPFPYQRGTCIALYGRLVFVYTIRDEQPVVLQISVQASDDM